MLLGEEGVRVLLIQDGDETAAEERAIEARSTPVWLEGKSEDVE